MRVSLIAISKPFSPDKYLFEPVLLMIKNIIRNGAFARYEQSSLLVTAKLHFLQYQYNFKKSKKSRLSSFFFHQIISLGLV